MFDLIQRGFCSARGVFARRDGFAWQDGFVRQDGFYSARWVLLGDYHI